MSDDRQIVGRDRFVDVTHKPRVEAALTQVAKPPFLEQAAREPAERAAATKAEDMKKARLLVRREISLSRNRPVACQHLQMRQPECAVALHEQRRERL